MSGSRNVGKLFVSNIPWTVNSNVLMKYFSEFGYVAQARVSFDKNTGLSKGFGHVTFANPESVETVLKKERHYIEGQNIIVQPADP